MILITKTSDQTRQRVCCVCVLFFSGGGASHIRRTKGCINILAIDDGDIAWQMVDYLRSSL